MALGGVDWVDLVTALLVGLVLYAGAAFAFVLVVVALREFVDEKHAKELAKRIANGLAIGSIATREQVEDLCRAVRDATSEQDQQAMANHALLRAYGWLQSKDLRRQNLNRKWDDEQVALLSRQIHQLSVEGKQDAPFAGVPTEERALLTDAVALMDSRRGALAKRKLMELAKLIEAKEKTVSRFVRIKKWTNVAALAGPAIAIFGTLWKLFSALN